jgi:hypothetical protein
METFKHACLSDDMPSLLPRGEGKYVCSPSSCPTYVIIGESLPKIGLISGHPFPLIYIATGAMFVLFSMFLQNSATSLLGWRFSIPRSLNFGDYVGVARSTQHVI